MRYLRVQFFCGTGCRKWVITFVIAVAASSQRKPCGETEQKHRSLTQPSERGWLCALAC